MGWKFESDLLVIIASSDLVWFACSIALIDASMHEVILSCDQFEFNEMSFVLSVCSVSCSVNDIVDISY